MILEKYKDRLRIEISLSQCHDPKDICAIMKHYKIEDYVYAFIWDNRIVKYGYSADYTGSPGERIYRQAGHLAGWRKPLRGSSGSDMLQIRMDFQEKYGQDLDRNEVVIWVVDMTKRPTDPDTYDSLRSCQELERHLINECVDYSKAAPIGNKDHATQNRAFFSKNKESFDRFIEFG